MCPEFELKSYSTAEVIFGKSKQEEVVYDIIQLMKRGSQALQDDVVITAADPETHNDPRLRSQNATVTVDLKGNRRPYVRVWGIVGEHFLYEVVELLRGAKWLNGTNGSSHNSDSSSTPTA